MVEPSTHGNGGSGGRFTIVENATLRRSGEALNAESRFEGIALTEDEREYMLPHFFMIIVGKPGSGKTQVIKRLLKDDMMYKNKFDFIFIVSPSVKKMGLRVPQERQSERFSLSWIYEKIKFCNRKQHERHTKPDAVYSSADVMNGQALREHMPEPVKGKSLKKNDKVRFRPSADAPNNVPPSSGARFDALAHANKGTGAQSMKTDLDSVMQEYKYASPEEQKAMHMNVLFIFDDVVTEIKARETESDMTSLFLNRRHLVSNGTVSIMMISQKYTLIPARLRSSASWLILFKLNPVDNESVYKDAILFSRDKWEELLRFVFGADEHTNIKSIAELAAAKRHDNLGIWVELDVFFKNFERILAINSFI